MLCTSWSYGWVVWFFGVFPDATSSTLHIVASYTLVPAHHVMRSYLLQYGNTKFFLVSVEATPIDLPPLVAQLRMDVATLGHCLSFHDYSL